MHCSQQRWIKGAPRNSPQGCRCSLHLQQKHRLQAHKRSHKRLWQATQSLRHRPERPSKRSGVFCYAVTAAGSSGGGEGAGATTQVYHKASFDGAVCVSSRTTHRCAYSAGARQATFSAEICAGDSARGYGGLCTTCPCSRKHFASQNALPVHHTFNPCLACMLFILKMGLSERFSIWEFYVSDQQCL